jgi:hypothetical protein
MRIISDHHVTCGISWAHAWARRCKARRCSPSRATAALGHRQHPHVRHHQRKMTLSED